jgi:hypothetical protein
LHTDEKPVRKDWIIIRRMITVEVRNGDDMNTISIPHKLMLADSCASIKWLPRLPTQTGKGKGLFVRLPKPSISSLQADIQHGSESPCLELVQKE